MNISSENLVKKIAMSLFDKKGTHIIALDVRGVSSVTDFILLANGNVDRHVIALSKEVEKMLLGEKVKPIQVEGTKNGDWVVLDYSNFVIHLFLPDMREKYQLERLWSDGKVIDLDRTLPCASKQSKELKEETWLKRNES